MSKGKSKPSDKQLSAEDKDKRCKDLDLPTYQTKGNARIITPAVKQYAKELYMNFYGPTEISKRTGIPLNTIAQYAGHKGDKSWKFEREIFANQVLQEFADHKKPGITKILNYSIQALTRSLESIATRKTPPTVDEALKISKIYDNLDKIVRLDNESPTSIVQKIKPASVVEIKKKIREKMKKDPWYAIDNAEYMELPTPEGDTMRKYKDGRKEIITEGEYEDTTNTINDTTSDSELSGTEGPKQ